MTYKRSSEGGRSDSQKARKKTKGKYYPQASYRSSAAAVPYGVEGFLVSCMGGRERGCGREVVNVLNQFWEEATGEGTLEVEGDVTRGDESGEDEEEGGEGEGEGGEEGEGDKKQNGGGGGSGKSNEEKPKSENIGSIDKLLESEIEDIRTMKKVRFVPLNTGCKAMIFIELKREEGKGPGPTELAEAIVRRTFESKKTQTRYTLKFLPVETTCYASASEIKTAVAPLIERHFPSGEQVKPLKFAIVLEARAYSGLDKMAIIKSVAEMVPEPHTVDLSYPDKSILIQIVKTSCTLSVVGEFRGLAKYNLRQIVCPEESGPKENNMLPKGRERKGMGKVDEGEGKGEVEGKGEGEGKGKVDEGEEKGEGEGGGKGKVDVGEGKVEGEGKPEGNSEGKGEGEGEGVKVVVAKVLGSGVKEGGEGDGNVVRNIE